MNKPVHMKQSQPATTAVNRRRDWKSVFLSHLARMGVVKVAAEAAGICRQAVYEHRAKDKGFAALWDEALANAADVLEAEAFRRAVEGVIKHMVNKNGLVWVPTDEHGNIVEPDDPLFVRNVPLIERVYSDSTLLAMLRAKKPQEYRDNISFTTTRSPVVDDPLVLVHTSPPPKPAGKG
jgi:hypothetical protein